MNSFRQCVEEARLPLAVQLSAESSYIFFGKMTGRQQEEKARGDKDNVKVVASGPGRGKGESRLRWMSTRLHRSGTCKNSQSPRTTVSAQERIRRELPADW